MTICVSFVAGRALGYGGARLVGYSLGSTVAAMIIVGLSQFIKRARTLQAISKIAFFTLLLFFFGTTANLITETSKRSRIFEAIDPGSVDVGDDKAIPLALQIEELVRQDRPHDIDSLYDADYFSRKALSRDETKYKYAQDVALGAGEGFVHTRILEQMASMVKEDGEFSFVKFYKREGEPILQFRLTEASGSLHYLDFYVFKSSDAKIRIGDARYYNSGDRFSKQIIASAAGLVDSLEAAGAETLQKAVNLVHKGQIDEARALIESLPEATKQQRMIMRLRLQLSFDPNSSEADEVLREFKQRFPDDPSIVFSAFIRAVAMDDVDGAATLLDDIYQIVDGDDYLLWYKVKLFLVQNNYAKAVEILSDMKTRYGIDVSSMAADELTEEFLSSKEYRNWLRDHEQSRRNRKL